MKIPINELLNKVGIKIYMIDEPKHISYRIIYENKKKYRACQLPKKFLHDADLARFYVHSPEEKISFLDAHIICNLQEVLPILKKLDINYTNLTKEYLEITE